MNKSKLFLETGSDPGRQIRAGGGRPRRSFGARKFLAYCGGPGNYLSIPYIKKYRIFAQKI